MPSVAISFTLLVSLTLASVARAENQTAEPVELTGVVVTLHDFFTAAGDNHPAPDTHWLTDRALVTADGMFSFLESPQNETMLRDVKPGDSVTVNAHLLESSALLYVDVLEVLDEPAEVDVKAVRDAEGERVTLNGRNACQCQLVVGDLPHSCTLGHLHHLQTDDQTIYHYLPVGDALKNLRGQDTHGKTITVTALLLPGNHLLLESTTVQ